MQRFALSFFGSVLVAALSASSASADYIYNVNFSDPNQNGPGDVSVSGTITVDKLGSLGASDFTDYSLTFSSPNSASATLTTANSSLEYVQQGSTINATATELSMTFPLASLFHSDVFLIYNLSFDQSFQLSQTYGNPAARNIGNGSDSSFVSIGSDGVTTVIGTAAAAVPEPSSFVLAAIGIAAVTGYQIRRRKLARA
jgi:hypothetical protein